MARKNEREEDEEMAVAEVVGTAGVVGVAGRRRETFLLWYNKPA